LQVGGILPARFFFNLVGIIFKNFFGIEIAKFIDAI